MMKLGEIGDAVNNLMAARLLDRLLNYLDIPDRESLRLWLDEVSENHAHAPTPGESLGAVLEAHTINCHHNCEWDQIGSYVYCRKHPRGSSA
jgi:hypothetical protein